MEVFKSDPLVDEILDGWRQQIGDTFDGYRGHVYRVLNCCQALRDCSPEEAEKLAIAGAFHDLGLWSDDTLDYLPPSVARAQQWLRENGRAEWSEEISLIIDMHHKVRPYGDPRFPLVELFRRADLIDASLGLFRFGLSKQYIAQLKAEIPNAGFHRFLLRGGKQWFAAHPLSLPPFLKW